MAAFKRIILFGDSLTQFSFSTDGCWGALLADHFQRQYDVINRGFSGYNARWCRLLLPKLLKQESLENLSSFIIFLGANDSNLHEKNPLQHVPVSEYGEALDSMVNQVLEKGLTFDNIVLIGPPPCVTSKWKAHCDRIGSVCGKDNDVVLQYSDTCQAVAKKHGIKHVELYRSMVKEKNWEDFLHDGLHFSSRGSQFVFDALIPHLQHLKKEELYPNWKDFNDKNPADVLGV